jgi:hypothetical protein
MGLYFNNADMDCQDASGWELCAGSVTLGENEESNAMFGHYGLKRPSDLTRFKASSTVNSEKIVHHFSVCLK